jgi:hypothetical protein
MEAVVRLEEGLRSAEGLSALNGKLAAKRKSSASEEIIGNVHWCLDLTGSAGGRLRALAKGSRKSQVWWRYWRASMEGR